MNKATIVSGLLASTLVAAQDVTGEFGRQMGGRAMMYGQGDGMMYGGSVLGPVLFGAFALGATILVWLWVVKMWRELRHHK